MWGKLSANGTYNGLMGEIIRSKADIGNANLFITLAKFNYIDLTHPFTNQVR